MGDSEWPKCRPFAGRILRKPFTRRTSVPEEQRCQNADGVRLESGWMLVTLPSGCSGTFPLESRRKGTFSRGAGSGGCSRGRTMSRERRTKRRQTMCLRRCQVFLVVRDNCGSCTDTEGSSCLLVELEGWTWWSSRRKDTLDSAVWFGPRDRTCQVCRSDRSRGPLAVKAPEKHRPEVFMKVEQFLSITSSVGSLASGLATIILPFCRHDKHRLDLPGGRRLHARIARGSFVVGTGQQCLDLWRR